MSRAEADAERDKNLGPLNTRTAAAGTSSVTLRRFVEDEYLTVKSRVWKASSRATSDQIVETHILGVLGAQAIPRSQGRIYRPTLK